MSNQKAPTHNTYHIRAVFTCSRIKALKTNLFKNELKSFDEREKRLREEATRDDHLKESLQSRSRAPVVLGQYLFIMEYDGLL